jgi:signal transduction histidine kinase/CheY-like chemotaxis protein
MLPADGMGVDVSPEAFSRDERPGSMTMDEHTTGGLRRLVRRTSPLSTSTPCSELHDLFKHEDAETLVVLEGDRPIGIVTARALADAMAAQFGFSLYAKRPVTELMSREFQVINSSESLAHAVELVFSRSREQMYVEFVVVEEGKYLGLLSVARLLSELHSTIALQVQELTTVNTHLADTVNQLTTTQQSLQRARDEAEVANRAKDVFLSTVSHELRTPMNGILGMTQLVLDTPLTDDQQECIDTIKTSADLMMTLINHILDFSKIQSHRLKIETIPFSMWDAVLEVARPLALSAWNKRLEFDLSIDPDIPAMVMGDPLRLKQILNNLVGNAIKFTERGEITVRIERDRVDPGRLHIVVADSGIGIPEEKQRVIFEPFVQSDDSTTRHYGGTGLGLSIVRELTSLMGGEVDLKSIPGLGSEFHVTLRCEPVQPEILDLRKNAYKGSVVLVRPTARKREYLEGLIRSWGFHLVPVRCVHAAKDADVPVGERPVLVLDIPRIPNGISWEEELRNWYADPSVRGTTVVLLAYAHDPLTFLQGHSAFPYRVVRKPFSGEELREAISQPLGEIVLSRQDAGEGSRTTAVRRILVAEDNEISAQVIAKYLRKAGHRATIVHDGVSAVEKATQEPFDVILMDLQMPLVDGLEATRRIRRWELSSGSAVTIIALTADVMPGDRQRCMDAGMNDYLSKPVIFAQLEEKLRLHTVAEVPRP